MPVSRKSCSIKTGDDPASFHLSSSALSSLGIDESVEAGPGHLSRGRKTAHGLSGEASDYWSDAVIPRHRLAGPMLNVRG